MTVTYTKAQSRANELLKQDIPHLLLYGGSRSGKTFLLTCYCALVAGSYPGIRIAILRRYLKDVRESILEDTFPKVMMKGLNWSYARLEASMNRSEMIFRHNDSEIWFAGLDDKDRVEKILGKEYGLIYFNEVSQIPWQSIQVARTRLAQKVEMPTSVIGATPWQNRFLYDCNPPKKSHWVHRAFIEKLAPDRTPLVKPEDYASFRMNPDDNLENLSESYMSILQELKGDNRKRFLEGEFTDENEKALWKQSTMIDPFRVTSYPHDMNRIVVGVDPAVTSAETSDSTGIIIAGRKGDHFYILDDLTLQGTPYQWANTAVAAYRKWNADRIVAESNQGGDMVRSTIASVDWRAAVRLVHASRGKIVRAEPVAALYEQGYVHHVGAFMELEEQMTSYTGEVGESSPDRMDALVWAMTELMSGGGGASLNFSFN